MDDVQKDYFYKMKEALKITLVQADLIWQQPEANRVHFTEMIARVEADSDVVVLPEMFSTGFTMNPNTVAETMDGETVVWMKEMARQKQVAIMGSVIIVENDLYRNRFIFVMPSGEIVTYDKRHSFTLAGEDKTYAAGKERVVIDYLGWKWCPMICYDLRFPVWSRNTQDFDALIYVANWPQPRINAWDALLKARAIENMCYCIGVNRIGEDPNGHRYPGHSSVYDVLGAELVNMKHGNEGLETIILNKHHIETNRKKLGFLKDRDLFTLQEE
ncbi:amidohydrolase [Sungkyunkwania multivorans]|uniref:Amidohydrolase n=1 Tax=Sungkyunkwania multivorans TaxID=1173618 RepID=A0ABW3D006_9FLAO